MGSGFKTDSNRYGFNPQFIETISKIFLKDVCDITISNNYRSASFFANLVITKTKTDVISINCNNTVMIHFFFITVLPTNFSATW